MNLRRDWTLSGSLIVVVLLTAALPLRLRAEESKAYYNIKSVKTEQLSNAVRVTITADGTISPTIERWWYWSDSPDRYYYFDMSVYEEQQNQLTADCFPRVSKILVHLSDARPQVGSVVQIGKYPVSHIKFVMAPDSDSGFGADVEVVLYRPMRMRCVDLPETGQWDVYDYHHDPTSFRVAQSPDKRSLIIIAASDRPPDVSQHRSLADTPEGARELSVTTDNGLLDVHAKNAALSDILSAVGTASGRRITGKLAKDKVVTAELSQATPNEVIERLAECYGLMVGAVDGETLLCDSSDLASVPLSMLRSRSLPIHNMTAATALDLLPNFLADYVHVDEGSNSLVVTGSAELIEKIRSDLVTIDCPSSMVSVKTYLVEASVSSDLVRSLSAEYRDGRTSLSASSETGDVIYSRALPVDSNLSALLHALATEGKVRIRDESSATVISGQTAEVFAGVAKYITMREAYSTEASAIPINIGLKLSVTPRVGDQCVTIKVDTDVSEQAGVDALTGLTDIARRTTSGTLLLRSGETLAIAGLRQQQTERSTRKLSGASGVPVLGEALARTSVNSSSDELILFVTPTILDSPERVSVARNDIGGKR